MAAASAALLDKRIAEAEAWETREKAKYTLVICVLCVALDALEVIGLFLAPACECTCGDPSSGGGAGVVERATANGKHMNRMWPQMTVLFVIASGGFTAIFCGVVCMVSVCTFPPSWQGAKDVAVEFFKDKYIPFKLFLTVVGVGVLSYTINEYSFACPTTCQQFDAIAVCGSPSPNPSAYFVVALVLSLALLVTPCVAVRRGVRWVVW